MCEHWGQCLDTTAFNVNKSREKVAGAGFLSYLLGSEGCNQPSLFSWIASQACKQCWDMADRPVKSGLLHRPGHVLLGHGEQQTHRHRPPALSQSLGKAGCPRPRLLMEAWMPVPRLLRRFPQSPWWPVCRCLPPHHIPPKFPQMGCVSSHSLENTPQDDPSET